MLKRSREIFSFIFSPLTPQHFGPSSWIDRVCKNNLLTLEHLTTTMRQFIAEISAKMLNKMDENAEAI